MSLGISREEQPCRSHCFRETICRDGFPQVPFCWTGKGTPLPHCLNDDFAPPHLIDEQGLPKLAHHRRGQSHDQY